METVKKLSMHNIDELEILISDFSKTVFTLNLAFGYFDNNLRLDTDLVNDEKIQDCLRLIDECRSNFDTQVCSFITFEKCLSRETNFNAD